MLFLKNKKEKEVKTMKKLLADFVLAVLMLSYLCSCELFGSTVDEQGDVTVVIENTDGTYETYDLGLESVENKDEGAKGVVEALSKREENPLAITMEQSEYGAFVTAVGSIEQDAAAGAYVMVYTSVSSDSYEGAPSVDYEGVTLYQSGVGLSGMTVEAGTVILFRLETY